MHVVFEVRNLAVLCEQMSFQTLKKREEKKVENYATPLKPKPHWLSVLSQGRPSFHGEKKQLSLHPFITAARLNGRGSTLPAVFVLLCNRCYAQPALQAHSRVQYFCISSHFFNPPTTAWHCNYITVCASGVPSGINSTINCCTSEYLLGLRRGRTAT